MSFGAAGMSRRSFLRTSTAAGLAGGMGGLAAPAFAQSDLPDPQSVLDQISVKTYVREDYQELYNMTGEPLWDPGQGLDPHRRLGSGAQGSGRQDGALRHRRGRSRNPPPTG